MGNIYNWNSMSVCLWDSFTEGKNDLSIIAGKAKISYNGNKKNERRNVCWL
jgi:hypothetical protein